MWSPSLSAVTLVKLSIVLLGVLNLALMFKGRPSLNPRAPSTTKPRQVYVRNHPSLQFLHLDTRHARPRTFVTEKTVHYPINGTLADLEWASLVPAENHGYVLLGPDEDVRSYAVSMFHSLQCLDRIRKAIVSPPPQGDGESGRPTVADARKEVHHCFNYLRQMILCAANTRLNPVNYVFPSGKHVTNGMGLTYECRDWDAVYEAFEANRALNRTVSRFTG